MPEKPQIQSCFTHFFKNKNKWVLRGSILKNTADLFFRNPPLPQISTFSSGQKGCAYHERSAYNECAYYECVYYEWAQYLFVTNQGNSTSKKMKIDLKNCRLLVESSLNRSSKRGWGCVSDSIHIRFNLFKIKICEYFTCKVGNSIL